MYVEQLWLAWRGVIRGDVCLVMCQAVCQVMGVFIKYGDIQ